MADSLFSLFIFALVTGISPGPNNIMIMSSAMNFGVRRSLPHMLGIGLGFSLMFAVLLAGFNVFVETLPRLLPVIKVVGVVYLLYLAWLIANSHHKDGGGSVSDIGKPFGFFKAFFFQWANPKAWVVIIGVISTFLTPSALFSIQNAVYFGVFLITGLSGNIIWMLFGGRLRMYLKNEFHRKTFNIIMGLLLALSLLPVVYAMVFS